MGLVIMFQAFPVACTLNKVEVFVYLCGILKDN
jgi:hypothetical protein